jgi:ferredoxin-NADP reductase
MIAAATLEMTVMAKDEVADGVVALTLAHRHDRRLPDWTPGAHIDLVLPNGVIRQYSLCGDRWDSFQYRIAVLREPDSRGGSSYIHDALRVGDTVSVGGPRNNFTLVPSDRYLFVAGGIGITPLLPMVRQAELLGCDWRLEYAGRSRRTMAFLDELAAYGAKVSLRPADEGGRGDVRDWADAVAADTPVYCCGPAGMIEAVCGHCRSWPPGRLRVEHFVPAAPENSARDGEFRVRLRRSGTVLTVRPGQSVLDAIVRAGTTVLSSCRRGVCGTCETAVLEGQPDHRDTILDDAERGKGDCMFVCVSRARSELLVLDL